MFFFSLSFRGGQIIWRKQKSRMEYFRMLAIQCSDFSFLLLIDIGLLLAYIINKIFRELQYCEISGAKWTQGERPEIVVFRITFELKLVKVKVFSLLTSKNGFQNCEFNQCNFTLQCNEIRLARDIKCWLKNDTYWIYFCSILTGIQNGLVREWDTEKIDEDIYLKISILFSRWHANLFSRLYYVDVWILL